MFNIFVLKKLLSVLVVLEFDEMLVFVWDCGVFQVCGNEVFLDVFELLLVFDELVFLELVADGRLDVGIGVFLLFFLVLYFALD